MRVVALVLVFMLCATPAFTADVAIYLLTPDRPDLTQEEYNAGVLQKGSIFSCHDLLPFGPGNPPPRDDIGLVRVEPMTKSECETYRNSWIRNIDFTVVNYNAAQDGYRLDVYAVVPGVSGYGNLSRDRVETYINEWGGTVKSIPDANTVRFDIRVFDAATSTRFWDGHNVAAVAFSESYNQGTGYHTITADYSGAPFVGHPEAVDEIVLFKGGNIISNDGSTIVFEIHRDTVIEAFKQDAIERVQDYLWATRYYFAPADVDTLISNGRFMSITRTQWDNNIMDRAD